MSNLFRPATVKLGITERIGWHTFCHTYSSLLPAISPEGDVFDCIPTDLSQVNDYGGNSNPPPSAEGNHG